MEKSKVLNSWPNSNFPPDLLPEVLSRLPVKSLLRFQCVCRPWLDLINDPDFARSHLNRFTNNHRQTHLLSYHKHDITTRYSTGCVVRCSETLEITSKLAMLTNRQPDRNYPTTLPAFEDVHQWEIVSSVDGLCMLVSGYLCKDQIHYILWNPSIRKYRIVPAFSEFETSEDMDALQWSLGFDPVSQDYKYVRVVQTGSMQFIAVYSVGKDSWKKIEIQGERLSCWRRYLHSHVQGIHLRGILYALKEMRDDGSLKLVTFDLSKEILDSIALPDELKFWRPKPYQVLTMADGGSSLAIIRVAKNNGFLWVCQNIEGDNKYLNWTKRYSFTCSLPEARDWYQPNLLYTKKNGELLFSWAKLMTSYHLETQEEKILLQNFFYEGPFWTYIESLVLLK